MNYLMFVIMLLAWSAFLFVGFLHTIFYPGEPMGRLLASLWAVAFVASALYVLVMLIRMMRGK